MTAIAHNATLRARQGTAQEANAQICGYCAWHPYSTLHSIAAIRFRKHGGFTGKTRATMVRKRHG